MTGEHLQPPSPKSGKKRVDDIEEEFSTASNTSEAPSSDKPLLTISPPSLNYTLPLPKNSMDTQLLLTNNNDKLCAFLVRTNSPKSYLARPNSGFIPPGQSQAVLFSARISEIPKTQDKFQIKAVLVNDETEINDVKLFWKHVERSRVAKQIISCNVVESSSSTPPDDNTKRAAPGNANPTGTSSTAPTGNGVPLAQEGNDELTIHRKTIFRYKDEIEGLKNQVRSSSKTRNLIFFIVFFVGLLVGYLTTYIFQLQ